MALSVLVTNEQTYFFHTLSRNFWLPLALFWETIRESSLVWAWTGVAKILNNAIENMSNRLNFIVWYYLSYFEVVGVSLKQDWCRENNCHNLFIIWPLKQEWCRKNAIDIISDWHDLFKFGLWNKNIVELRNN